MNQLQLHTQRLQLSHSVRDGEVNDPFDTAPNIKSFPRTNIPSPFLRHWNLFIRRTKRKERGGGGGGGRNAANSKHTRRIRAGTRDFPLIYPPSRHFNLCGETAWLIDTRFLRSVIAFVREAVKRKFNTKPTDTSLYTYSYQMQKKKPFVS